MVDPSTPPRLFVRARLRFLGLANYYCADELLRSLVFMASHQRHEWLQQPFKLLVCQDHLNVLIDEAKKTTTTTTLTNKDNDNHDNNDGPNPVVIDNMDAILSLLHICPLDSDKETETCPL